MTSRVGPQGKPQRAPARPHLPPRPLAPYPDHSNLNFLHGRRLSLYAAWKGIRYVVDTQPNVWIELAAVGVVTATGLWLGITPVEWALLLLTFGMILALEAVNTAIETVVD
ncbi:MAG: diacylglycerol kinase family protein, partial [Litorilinea sp.]